MVIATNGKVGYEWRLGKRDYLIERRSRPLSELRFDRRNQRIQYALKANGVDPLKADSNTIGETLNEFEKQNIGSLYHAIYEAGGLVNPLITTSDGVVVEGNCRLAALHRLCANFPNEEFCSPPCEVLPEDFDEEARLLYLGDCHVAGKQAWDPYEIADHVHKMTQLGKTQEFVAKTLRMSKTTVNRYVDAFEMHNEFLRDNPDSANVHKWSYFFEFQKKKALREHAKENPKFKERFFRWVRDGRINGMQVRELPALIGDDNALKALDQRGLDQAKAVHAEDAVASESGKDWFPVLDRAMQELEGLPVRELERLSRPDSAGAAKMRDLYRRLNSIARMAGLTLETK